MFDLHQPIKRVSLQTEIIKYIQDYIADNRLEPGDKLPSQGALMDMMQVSRTALREAVKTLEAKGVIEVQNGKGLYVGVEEKEQHTLESLLGVMHEKELLLEILEVRRFLEKEIVNMVVQKASDDELKELGGIVEQLMEKIRLGERQTEIDKAFHYKVYELCHNRVMYSVICSLSEYTDRLWEFPLDMKDPFEESMPYHEKLYQALCARDAKQAQKMNNKLLDYVISDIIKYIA